MERYTLLALAGQTPQVITESVWSVARELQMMPAAVHVLTTAVGAAYVRARLLGEAAVDPVRGMALEPATYWDALCRELGEEVLPLHVHVPEDADLALTDVRGKRDDQAFADALYALTARLTRPGQPPLLGSLAGGRKTMSAHLMTAFSLCARPEDRLLHVLVQPPSLERQPDFFFPTAAFPDARIRRIDVPFPRVRSMLPDDRLPADQEPATLRAWLEAIAPYDRARQPPTHLTLHFVSNGLELTLHGPGGPLGHQRLTPMNAATFAALANAIKAQGGRAQRAQLLPPSPDEKRAHSVYRQRHWVAGHCNDLRDTIATWTAHDDISKALTRLHKQLHLPALQRYLSIDIATQADGNHQYTFAEPLDVPWYWTTRAPLSSPWPFDYLKAPEHQAEPADPSSSQAA